MRLGTFSLTRSGSKTDQATGAAADSLVEKVVVFTDFTAGDTVEEIPGTCTEKVLRIPATLERKECFLFCLTLEDDRDQHVFGDHNHEVYRTTHHDFFKFVDLVGRGTPIKVCSTASILNFFAIETIIYFKDIILHHIFVFIFYRRFHQKKTKKNISRSSSVGQETNYRFYLE